MKHISILVIALLWPAAPGAAHTTLNREPAATPAQSKPSVGVMADLLSDVQRLESKVVALAKAMPETAYDWRPTVEVRSTAEVFRHVAADNYFVAANLGGLIAADSGIKGKDYNQEIHAYEERKLTRAAIIAALEQSFALLTKAMSNTTEDKLAEDSNYFSTRKVTVRTAWIMTTTHLHEHLGQLITYARSNKIVPPWSK